LGFIPTVRIGAGAWRKWAPQEKAATPIRPGRTFTQRKKERRNERKTEQKLLRTKTPEESPRRNPASGVIENSPLARATPLHYVALRAASVIGKENLAA
jgi:hypothetical protein